MPRGRVPFSSFYGSRLSSWSMLKPSLISLGVRHADCVASFKLKPDVKTELSKKGRNQISFAIVWDLSVDGFSVSVNHIPNVSECRVNRRFCRSQVAFSILSSITFFINFVNSSNSNFGSSSLFFQSPQHQSVILCEFQRLSVKFLELLHTQDHRRVDHVQDFRIPLAQISQERRNGHRGDASTGDLVKSFWPSLMQ